MSRFVNGNDFSDIALQVQSGNISDAKMESAFVVWKFGRNESVGATEEPIWDGEAAYTYLTTASVLTLVSDDVNDTMDVVVQGLDANWNAISEIVTMNGTTGVNTTNAFIRTYRAWNDGDTDMVGDITISAGATLQAKIQAYSQQTLMSLYTIPAGHTGYLFRGTASTPKGKDIQIFYKVRLFGKVFRIQKTFGLYQSTYNEDTPWAKIPEKSDITVNATSTVSTTDVSSDYSLLVLKNL